MIRFSFAALALLSAASPSFANDSIAELGTGGIVMSRSDVIAMESEDLFISMEKVEVNYVFRNGSDEDIETIVAFPMPDVEANPYSMPSLPYDTHDNFLGFEVSVDGEEVKPTLDSRAFAVGIDVTDELKKHGVPVYPFNDAASAALEKLPQAIADDWIARGIIFIDSYDAGKGWEHHRTPSWLLRSTYWWRAKFPAGDAVEVWHRYLPSVGASAGLNFFFDAKFQGSFDDYKTRFCLDDGFERAIRKAADAGTDGYPQLSEHRIQYVLTTGGNWALGRIGKFHLTIDKGAPENIVSFCGKGVRKTGPTRFEMSAEDFFPERNIDILILKPNEAAQPTSAGQTEGKPASAGAKLRGQPVKP